MQIIDNTDSAENCEFSSKNGEKYSKKKKKNSDQMGVHNI